MTLVVHTPPGHEAARRYVIDLVVGQWLGLDCVVEVGASQSGVTVTLPGTVGELRFPDVLLGTDPEAWLRPASLPPADVARKPLPEWLGADVFSGGVPSLYGHPGAQMASREPDNSVTMSIDLFGGIFFLLSRYEELVIDERDGHERFPATASVLHRLGYLQRPLADEYAMLLAAGLRTVWPAIALSAPQPGEVVLTHDIDLAFASRQGGAPRLVRGVGADLVKRRDPALAMRRTAAYLRHRAGRYPRGDPFDTYDWLMGSSERAGLRSAFFFLTERTNSPTGPDYGLDEPWIRRLLRRISDRGHEIGLHASYGSMDSANAVNAELSRLRQAADSAGVQQDRWGGRAHFLRWAPSSWTDWDAAGLQYDASVSFADAPGFRCGTGRSFPTFDLMQERPLAIEERPLLVMDASLFSYLHLRAGEALTTALGIARRSLRFGGDAVILWHNSTLVSREQRETYEALVEGLTRP